MSNKEKKETSLLVKNELRLGKVVCEVRNCCSCCLCNTGKNTFFALPGKMTFWTEALHFKFEETFKSAKFLRIGDEGLEAGLKQRISDTDRRRRTREIAFNGHYEFNGLRDYEVSK